MKRLFCTFVLFFSLLHAEEYQFSGVHYMGSYMECDHDALCDLIALQEAMELAVKECGATLLTTSEYTFSPDAMTMVLLLSESHASIHTYPEYDACYVDLFTCGNRCDYKKFENALRNYLNPAHLETRIIKR